MCFFKLPVRCAVPANAPLWQRYAASVGLSLSDEIVTQGHGGSLSVESEDGSGATFTITLPGLLP